MKSKVNKLDLDKLVPVLVDLSKLNDAVKIMLLKKEIYNAKIEIIEDIITDITDLTTNTTLNAKTNKVENEMPNITNLATITTALATDENKIPDHSKYITTREFNKLTTEKFCLLLLIS